MKTRQIIADRKQIAELYENDYTFNVLTWFADKLRNNDTKERANLPYGFPTATAENIWTEQQMLSLQERIRHVASKMAETCYVSYDMQQLAMRAAADMPEEGVTIDMNKIPIRCGFMSLEEPIWIKDVVGHPVPIRGILWQAMNDSVLLGYYTTREHSVEKWSDPEWNEKNGRDEPQRLQMLKHYQEWPNKWMQNSTMIVNNEDGIGRKYWMAPRNDEGDFRPLTSGSKGEIYESPHLPADVDENVMDEVISPNAVWYSLMILMNQKIARVTEVQPHRRDMRQMDKWQFKPAITVIEYRRSESILDNEHNVGTGRKLNFRHVVRGHWRTNHRTGNKDIYVSPHFRGPEDAPLYVSHKINAMVR